MDKIIIKDLELYAFHGVNEEEKRLGQRFLISIEARLDLQPAGKTDDLTKTINYALLCHEIEKEFTREKHDLIESIAEDLCSFVLIKHPNIASIKLMVKKPWAPIGKSLDYAAVEIERSWHLAYIGFGSNMGDKKENINQAIALIQSNPTTIVTKVSKLYETDPVGYLDQDLFINGVIELKTLLSPKALIEFLLGIEQELKRERIIKNGPRTIDLDVLLYDDCITSYEEIIVPHPRMHERAFVLEPLCDLAPYHMHPVLQKRMIQLYEDIMSV